MPDRRGRRLGATVVALAAIVSLVSCASQVTATGPSTTFDPNQTLETIAHATFPVTIATTTTTQPAASPTTGGRSTTSTTTTTTRGGLTAGVAIPCGTGLAVAPAPAANSSTIPEFVYSYGLSTNALTTQGAVSQLDHNRLPTVTAMTSFFTVDDPSVIAQALTVDGYNGGARAEWNVGPGIDHVLELSFLDQAGATKFLAQQMEVFCPTTSGIRSIPGVPGGVSYYRISGGENTGRASFVVKNSLINLTVCGCAGDAQGLAEKWAAEVSAQLSST